MLEHAREKLARKGLDFIVANDVTAPGAGFQVDTNRVVLMSRDGLSRELAGSKREVAALLWDELAGRLRTSSSATFPHSPSPLSATEDAG